MKNFYERYQIDINITIGLASCWVFFALILVAL